MNFLEHLRHLFAYNDWANNHILASFKINQSEQAQKVLSHILLTESEYFERLYGKDSTDFDFWQNLTVEECEKLERQNRANFETLLRNSDEENLSKIVKYKTSKGVSYQNALWEMLTHVLFHSATHRGNIIKILRDENFAPPATDYIIYLRENV